MGETRPRTHEGLSEEALELNRQQKVAKVGQSMAQSNIAELEWQGEGAFQVTFVDSPEADDFVALVRRGDDPDGPVLRFTSGEWNAFVGNEQGGVLGGEFDRVIRQASGETT